MAIHNPPTKNTWRNRKKPQHTHTTSNARDSCLVTCSNRRTFMWEAKHRSLDFNERLSLMDCKWSSWRKRKATEIAGEGMLLLLLLLFVVVPFFLGNTNEGPWDFHPFSEFECAFQCQLSCWLLDGLGFSSRDLPFYLFIVGWLEVTKNNFWKGHLYKYPKRSRSLNCQIYDLFFVFFYKGLICKVALKGQVAISKIRPIFDHQLNPFFWRDFPIFTTHWRDCPENLAMWSHTKTNHLTISGGRRLKVQLPDGDEKLEIDEMVFGWSKVHVFKMRANCWESCCF